MAVAYAVVQGGGDHPFNSSVSLLFVGFAVLAAKNFSDDQTDAFSLGALALVALVGMQLVPLPLSTIGLISPARAELANGLGSVMAVPGMVTLSIAAPTTWAQLPRIAGYAAICLLIRQTARQTVRDVPIAVVPLVMIATLEAAWALTGHVDGSIVGTFTNKNHFASLIEIALPFALVYGIAVLATRHERERSALALIAGAGLLTAAVLISFGVASSLSKGGLLSMLASLLAIGFLVIVRWTCGWRRWAIAGGLVTVVVAVLVFATPSELVQQFAVFTSDNPTEGRVPIWRDAVRLAAAYPALGVGLGNFFPGVVRYQTSGLGVAWTAAHNDYLQWLSELGIVGLFLGAVVIGSASLWTIRASVFGQTRVERTLGLACAGALSAILIHSVFEFNAYVLANAMASSWVVGLAASLQPEGIRGASEHRRGFSIASLQYAVPVLGCFLLINSAGWLVFLERFQNDMAAERLFCRFGICDTTGALIAAERLHGGDSADVVPLADLSEFLRREPASSSSWMDFADAAQRAGGTDAARAAVARALTLAPHSPPVLLRAAAFHVEASEERQALELVSRSLALSDEFDEEAFAALDRASIDEVLTNRLPNSRSARGYLRRLLLADKASQANALWTWMVSRKYVDGPLANQYVESLVRRQDMGGAWKAWTAYAAGRCDGYPDANLIFNGGFEEEPLGGRFDWAMWGLQDDVKVDLDESVAHTGHRSLRLRFGGRTNVAYQHTSQTTLVGPGVYRFRAFVRTEALTTDKGIGFRISGGAGSTRVSVATEARAGTSDWRAMDAVVRVDAAMPVTVQAVRVPSLKFDNQVAGTAWIDDVSLERIGSTNRE
jgi:hypothetical protein